MIFIKGRLNIYTEEFCRYFKNTENKKDLKKLSSTLPKYNGFITADSIIKIIEDEYKTIIKSRSDYEYCVIKLKDQLNNCSGIDKNLSSGLLFIGGFILSKSSDILKSYTNLSISSGYYLTLILAVLIFFYILFTPMSSKQAESFYQLCLNVLENMKDKIQYEDSSHSTRRQR